MTLSGREDGSLWDLPRSRLHLRTLVVTESEWFAPYKLITCNAGTPVLFDVFDCEVRAVEVTSIIAVVGVGQVAAQERLLTQIDELTKTKRPTQYADIRSDAHHHYILDATLLKQIVDFLAIVTDRVLASNLNRFDLANPRMFALSTARLSGMARARSGFSDSSG